MNETIKHPTPVGQKSYPAELVPITYLHDVTCPDFKVGKAWQTKDIERHWAEQLVAEGYAKFAEPAPAEAESEPLPAPTEAEPHAEAPKVGDE